MSSGDYFGFNPADQHAEQPDRDAGHPTRSQQQQQQLRLAHFNPSGSSNLDESRRSRANSATQSRSQSDTRKPMQDPVLSSPLDNFKWDVTGNKQPYPKQQIQPHHIHSLGPRSPGAPSGSNMSIMPTGASNLVRSPNATSSVSHGNAAGALNSDYLVQRHPGNSPGLQPLGGISSSAQSYHSSSSTGSSARSSRRPSVVAAGGSLSKFTAQQQQLPPIKTVGSAGRSISGPSNNGTPTGATAAISVKDKRHHDSNTTVLISPEMASSLNTLSSLTASTLAPTSSSTPKHHERSMVNKGPSSVSGAGSSVSLRSFKKQYILNEQLYLERMKNRIHDDDYYTRGIVPTNDSEEDFDLEVDDIYDIQNSSASINKANDTENFGINFFTTNDLNKDSRYYNLSIGGSENLLSISSTFLLHKLAWLKNSNPKMEQSIEEINEQLKNIQVRGNNDIIATNLGICMEELFQDPTIMERFEWQTMLINVLKGDIVRSEKTKIANENTAIGLDKERADNIWVELRAWMNGRTVEDQKKCLTLLRNSSDSVFKEVMEFKVSEDATFDEHEVAINTLLEKYFKVLTFWPNMKKMQIDKPITKTGDFNLRIETLVSWASIKLHLENEITKLAKWTRLENLNSILLEDPPDEIKETKKQFAEQIMKEKDIETIFQKKIFFPLAPWILKAKVFSIKAQKLIQELNLDMPNDRLEVLLLFPMVLLKEIISVRIAYAKKLQNPTMMMIDQMIEDFSSYIRLSVQLKSTLDNYRQGWQMELPSDPNFDKVIIEGIKYLFILLQLKILDGTTKTFRTSKEPEILLKYWDDLKNVGYYINGAGKVISVGFSKLTLRLLHRLHSYLLQEQNSPPTLKSANDGERWLTQIFENLGSMKRKLNRFTNVLTKAFQNSINYKIENYERLVNGLIETDHFLIYSGGELENNGVYLVASRELLGVTDAEIFKILDSTNIGCDLIPKLDIKNSLTIYNAIEIENDDNSTIAQSHDKDGVPYHSIETRSFSHHRGNLYSQNTHNTSQYHGLVDTKRGSNSPINAQSENEQEILDLEFELQSLGYLLVLYPSDPIIWEGKIFNLSEQTRIKFDSFFSKNPMGTMTLISEGSSYALEYQFDRFQQIAGLSASFLEKRCLLDAVENSLQRVNKAYFGCTYSMLRDYPKLVTTFKKCSPSTEVLNGIFLFCRDFGRNFLRNNIANGEKKSLIILLMVEVSVSWLKFLTDECDPSDHRTFRWCVTAMEFAMQMISGWNVLALNESQFKSLKQKISACMSLLISHFDVMGARAVEVEKMNQQLRPSTDIDDDFDVDAILQVNSELRMKTIAHLEESITRNPHQIGKVLDDTEQGNKYLSSLASSISNVSIRWQKRKYVGGGTFGSVYSAVNLDNGDILAVKEIKIQDSKAMEKIFPSVKEEMSVMEMLNHPNIIQYYGVEVHRDKVNIFMEYCEGGSLASLLEHGRIEDEMVTQVYTLELLEGLAYLHESGIVHRDIKPENILLDFNGIIKYVDFGAARKIASNETKIRTAGSGSSPGTSSSTDNLRDMIGTPMYMAPETITGSKTKGSFGVDDVWSLGCVVLEMVTGRRPWSNLDNEWAIMYHVAAGHIPQLPAKDEISEAGAKFFKRCLVYDPNKRATAVELLMDPWIVDIREVAFGTSGLDPSTETS
ncbi:mitogen-activated protein kinase kinase kinase SSK2 KNAG_0D00390 [Huiozyma naganishii CBS 8797]|uniref:Protein kinase domain-containing protein n=1 Tax=Huiozyma naganishii (strain ATCC MYA-139 / BCRC 22969 / CBS 8797 / KCTC 17520 / NBRC 10181 / NCYC 3082 / Yp74L-3) TaxID=1071383 RepID=J7RXI1_HUIN7|nr:hypothetical protein KNAG_0D00390 [Kazachstania naganishii CBS 8797]CCK69792.1 hypothetical protein KNAG_0D00390 [Kazachstania naganishii CBS 8797]